MPLSLNEIRRRAIEFSKEWENASSERADKQTFYNDFFNVFGISRRRVASFEQPAKKLGDNYGAIDLFWKGTLIVEHKSKGKDLTKAYSQALEYFAGLSEKELPKYVIVSDFQKFRLYDLDKGPDAFKEFDLKNLHKNIQLFSFISGYEKVEYKEQDPVNIPAAELMGELHDKLKESGYSGHELEVFLVRILFCLFAEDTGIFEKSLFSRYLKEKTNEDGSDLGAKINDLFQTLNTPYDKRSKLLDESLNNFPYVDGSLFEERLLTPAFNSIMRTALLDCADFNWSKISPAIFGAMFQSIMDPEKRRNLGGHYTSEQNIMKVIKSLFLDDLHREFEKCKNDKNKLQEFHLKLRQLKFLDPACGCGNFLVITYRELRLLEISILKAIYKGKERFLSIHDLSIIDVDAMYGIEIEEFPAKIAEVALWLMDHQMNVRLSEELGKHYVRIPLKKSASIIKGNALQLDWGKIISPEKLNFILGNPPFVGKKEQNTDQKADMELIFGKVKGAGVLDYVSCWYVKAAEYIQRTRILIGFVSTKSITQGEQVGVLWGHLFQRYHLKIHFAHRTFVWESEARGKAHVHVVIIGIGAFDTGSKRIYDYEPNKEEATFATVRNISPYLVEGGDMYIVSRSKPICPVPEIMEGSALIDDGHLLLSKSEAEDLRKSYSATKNWLRPFYSGDDFINGNHRWCLWLDGVDPKELRKCQPVMDRVEAVQTFRAQSDRAATKVLANCPSVFGELRQPRSRYIFVPKTSSEHRLYIPIAFMPPEAVINNTSLFIDGAQLYHFGFLCSTMHMAWLRQVGGRLKSDYRYSNKLVYNNYPWPSAASDKQQAAVEVAAQAVLDARAKYPSSTLADLYDPLAMPADLLKAHQALDRAVDRCYRPDAFPSDRHRVEYLFALYEKYTSPMNNYFDPKKKRKAKNT